MAATNTSVVKKVDELCKKIGDLVELNHKNETDIHLLKYQMIEVDREARLERERLDKVDTATTRNTTVIKVFGIVIGLLIGGSGLAFALIRILPL